MIKLYNKQSNIKLEFQNMADALEYAETLQSKTYIIERLELQGDDFFGKPFTNVTFKIKAIVNGLNNTIIYKEDVG